MSSTQILAEPVLDQRLRALRRGNEIRRRRAVERDTIKAMPDSKAWTAVGRLIVDCPDWLCSIPVHVLLRWAPGVGTFHAQQILQDRGLQVRGVRGTRHLGDLTEGGRKLLAQRLFTYRARRQCRRVSRPRGREQVAILRGPAAEQFCAAALAVSGGGEGRG